MIRRTGGPGIDTGAGDVHVACTRSAREHGRGFIKLPGSSVATGR